MSISAILVIFGGTGDLTHRKLIPALYNLVLDKLLPEDFAVVSVGRREKTTEQYRDEVKKSLSVFSLPNWMKIGGKDLRTCSIIISLILQNYPDIQGFVPTSMNLTSNTALKGRELFI